MVASTMCGVYNADIARFYRRLGCTRVIIPRDVSLDEIEAIVRAVPGVEYEAFVMRNGCVFADGLCLGRHIEGRNALCWDVARASRALRGEPGAAELDRALCENAQAYERLPSYGMRPVRALSTHAVV
ncbi:MAG: U32 family peptidase [Eggerthella lenta]